MNTGFTWDTQNQEFDKKMALETWQQAEQYQKTLDLNQLRPLEKLFCFLRPLHK
jgi:ATP:corrinoid adenosyltransferase